MNNLTTFDFNTAPVRIVTIDGDPWFVAMDVAEVLGYAKPRNAIKRHCKGALKRGVLSGGGDQETTIIPERDLYRLIFNSKLPSAERFEDWVVGTVLPAIRKTGGYIAGEETMTNDELVARAMEVLQAKIAEKDAKIAQQAPKVAAQALLEASEGALRISNAARSLGMAERTFNKWLHENKWTFTMKGVAHGNRRVPYADKRKDGLMEVVTGTQTNRYGAEVIVYSLYITPKGLAKLAEVLAQR